MVKFAWRENSSSPSVRMRIWMKQWFTNNPPILLVRFLKQIIVAISASPIPCLIYPPEMNETISRSTKSRQPQNFVHFRHQHRRFFFLLTDAVISHDMISLRLTLILVSIMSFEPAHWLILLRFERSIQWNLSHIRDGHINGKLFWLILICLS